jgi:hypothetical protein
LSAGIVIISYRSTVVPYLDIPWEKRIRRSSLLSIAFPLLLLPNSWLLADKTACPYSFSQLGSYWNYWNNMFFLYLMAGILIRLSFHYWGKWKFAKMENGGE